jgi:DNA mismatch repair protein MSH5
LYLYEIYNLNQDWKWLLKISCQNQSKAWVTKVCFLSSDISLIALALVAKENNYVRPVLTKERVLKIEGGRHPLQELCVDGFVPNDTFSGDQHSLMKIITGPNSSGKSVYLKQVMK